MSSGTHCDQIDCALEKELYQLIPQEQLLQLNLLSIVYDSPVQNIVFYKVKIPCTIYSGPFTQGPYFWILFL